MQKGCHEQTDMLHLMEYLLDRLTSEELELFWVQAWIIWNQRNCVVHGGKLRDPTNLNKRAAEYLEEYQQAQTQLIVNLVL